MKRKAKAKKTRKSIFGTAWKGGSFRAAVGGYLRKKGRRVGRRAKRDLVKGLKSLIF